jgi:hypothetical protein
MSFKEIKELRQAGKLDEALEMAHQALEAEPENIWNKRAAAWVYYDYLKKFSQPDSFDAFKENLIKIKDLQLPEDEKMIFDNCAWQIGRLVFALQKGKNSTQPQRKTRRTQSEIDLPIDNFGIPPEIEAQIDNFGIPPEIEAQILKIENERLEFAKQLNKEYHARLKADNLNYPPYEVVNGKFALGAIKQFRNDLASGNTLIKLKEIVNKANIESESSNPLTKLKSGKNTSNEAHLFSSILESQSIDNKVNFLFEVIKNFHFTKPSEAYSFIYKAFHKGYQNWSSYLTFADWWNFENLRSEDYLKEEFKGKKMMSLAEQAFIAYSKKLLEGEPVDPFGQERSLDKEKIQSFFPKLDAIIEKHPDYQYPPYFKAKLLLALGSNENILSAFLPFAKQKRNDFWVWELMAEIFSEEEDIQFACYCKALSLKTPEDFLVKLRQTFSEMLIEKKMYNEAKTEIQKVITTREKHEWKLPNQIVQWTEQEWYKSATAKKDNQDLYSNHIKQAEEILFQDIPEEIIAVEFVNENKRMLNFAKDKWKFGFFNYSGHLTKPQVGDILKVRFNGDGQDGFYKILTAQKADPDLTSEAIRNFEGVLKLISPQYFGFVDDVFIEPKLVQKYNLISDANLKGTAILSFNKKKNQWSWKAIKVK